MKISKAQLKQVIKEEIYRYKKISLLENRREQIREWLQLLKEDEKQDREYHERMISKRQEEDILKKAQEVVSHHPIRVFEYSGGLKYELKVDEVYIRHNYVGVSFRKYQDIYISVDVNGEISGTFDFMSETTTINGEGMKTILEIFSLLLKNATVSPGNNITDKDVGVIMGSLVKHLKSMLVPSS